MNVTNRKFCITWLLRFSVAPLKQNEDQGSLKPWTVTLSKLNRKGATREGGREMKFSTILRSKWIEFTSDFLIMELCILSLINQFITVGIVFRYAFNTKCVHDFISDFEMQKNVNLVTLKRFQWFLLSGMLYSCM